MRRWALKSGAGGVLRGWGPHSADLPPNDDLFCSVDHRVEDQIAFSQGQWHSKHFSWGLVDIYYRHVMPLIFFQ